MAESPVLALDRARIAATLDAVVALRWLTP
jgi:hypothetical protein